VGIYIYNSDEMKKIGDACAITANILDEIGDLIEDGISLGEIDAKVRELCKKSSSSPAFLGYRGFPAAICCAVNSEVIHGIPDKKKILKSGDIVGLDFGILYDGFYGDSARTFPVGKVSKEAEILINETKVALYKGIEAAVEGNRVSDISHAVESHVRAFGFSPVREFVGHGIGRMLHEEPAIPNYGEPGKGARIRNGMVFAIEPMINAGTHRVNVLDDGWTAVTEDGSLSAHFEHTVAIVNGRAVILTAGKFFK
jgi:methionyl aminopeptidase